MTSDFYPSLLKLKFADIILNAILNFNEGKPIYAKEIKNKSDENTPISVDLSLSSASSSTTDTNKIYNHLSCYIECYFFTAMSSLDALADEIFYKFNLEKPIRIYFAIFDPEKAEKNKKIKIILENLNQQNPNVLTIIQNFLKEDDFKVFKAYRDFIAHKSILIEEMLFNTVVTPDSSIISKLKHPIMASKILETDSGLIKNKEEIDLEAWFKKFHDKLRTFHSEIKKIRTIN